MTLDDPSLASTTGHWPVYVAPKFFETTRIDRAQSLVYTDKVSIVGGREEEEEVGSFNGEIDRSDTIP